mmetsp:Transcript_43636/g.93404  ORF Transcript_43636/g.93404 Transcript_43636/m.93404 type:complete len:221 (-) Transcript_43636:106-768(-)
MVAMALHKATSRALTLCCPDPLELLRSWKASLRHVGPVPPPWKHSLHGGTEVWGLGSGFPSLWPSLLPIQPRLVLASGLKRPRKPTEPVAPGQQSMGLDKGPQRPNLATRVATRIHVKSLAGVDRKNRTRWLAAVQRRKKGKSNLYPVARITTSNSPEVPSSNVTTLPAFNSDTPPFMSMQPSPTLARSFSERVTYGGSSVIAGSLTPCGASPTIEAKNL